MALTDTLTLGGLTAEAAATFGDWPVLRGDDPPRRWTHRQLEREVSAWRPRTRRSGTAPGARGVIVLLNGVDVFPHVLALARRQQVPINARLAASQREVIVRVARATAVVDAALAARIGAWLAAHPDAALGDVGRRPAREVALVLCTSGTTGVPKAAPITSEGILAVARLVHLLPLGQARGPRAGRDRLLCALPLAHIMGLATLLIGLAAGFEVIHQGRFVAPRVLATIATERVNVFVGADDVRGHDARLL
ncbi:MAG: AMP-binding protein [Myxococcota bacterium]